jgi:hypothetical protein
MEQNYATLRTWLVHWSKDAVNTTPLCSQTVTFRTWKTFWSMEHENCSVLIFNWFIPLCIWISSFYLVRHSHNYKLKQNKATGFGLFVPRPSSGSLPSLRKGQDLEPLFLQNVSMLIIYL